jgi:hypothetical protein
VRLIARIGALLTAGCAARVDTPRAIVLEDISARTESRAEFIDDYESALISIAAITEKDLGLPKLRGVLRLVPDREAFQIVRHFRRTWRTSGRDSARSGAPSTPRSARILPVCRRA